MTPKFSTLRGFLRLFNFIFSERPDSPVNATSFNIGPRWIALRWTPTFDGNREVVNFLVYISNVNTTSEFTQMENLTASSLMTRGRSFMFNISREGVILPFTQYTFMVVSCNVIGCSDQSMPSEVVQTDQDSEYNNVK